MHPNFSIIGEGFKTKLDGPSFLELIQIYDILILSKIWKTDIEG